MRAIGLSLAFFATVNVLVVSTPAFADDSGSTTTTTTTTPAATDGMVMLHVDSPKPVDIERRQGDVGGWQHVCTSPCDASVPLFDQYRIAEGADVNESKPFMIDAANKDHVTLKVDPGMKTKAKVGTYIFIAGAATIVTGVVVVIAGTAGSNQFGNDGTTNNSFTNVAFVGSALIIAGVGAAIVGGAWHINNKHSDVGGDTAKPPAQTNEKTASRDAVFVKPQAEQMVRTPAFVLPVFTKTF
ncbi:MAG: hypothetical protein ABIP39_06290 [Polyangiaceae bacterium]